MANNIDNIVYTIRIKNQNNDKYTSYNIGAKDENIEVNTGNDNNFLIQKKSEIPLSTVLPLKLNQETINSEADIKSFNKIIEQGIYSIQINLTDGPLADNSNSNLMVLKVGSIIHQIFFKLDEVYSRSYNGTSWEPDSSWNKNIGEVFTKSDSSNVGTRGLVPEPPTNSQTGNFFLNADGKWTSLNTVFARLGESETFAGTPTFSKGFISQGTDTPSTFSNIVSITASDPIGGKALSVTNGISAGNGKFGSINIGDTTVIDSSRNGIFADVTGTGKGSFSNLDINSKVSITSEGIVNITNNTDASTDSTPAGALKVTGGIYSGGRIYAYNGVYNAVWNDLVDSIIVNKDAEIEAGYCYCLKDNKYIKSSKYLDNGIIGIHSDTYGFKMGEKAGEKQLDCAVAGFVLAYVDKDYLPGTALTCTKDGRLTKMKLKDKQRFPEKIVATYWKDEPNEEWGSDNRKVKVNGRKWVKIK